MATRQNNRTALRREEEPNYRQPAAQQRRRGEVCVVQGYGIRIAVERGRLVVNDGFGRDRRQRRYSRATSKLARLVVLGHAGYITLEAIRWLADLGIPHMHVDADGRMLASSATGTVDARLRRAQALALTNEIGLEIARSVLSDKLAGQRQLLPRLQAAEWLVDSFNYASELLQAAASINELVMAERDAALAYWQAWATVTVPFRPSDRERVPEQWLTFVQRGSPLTSSSRLAVNPANAILNYLYALLETETTIACHAVGLDPTLGIVHADVRGRDSLALDLMEPSRPHVDAHVLDLLEGHEFAASDFFETRKGACRVLPPLSERLAETTIQWASAAAPIAEQVAAALAKAPGSRIDRVPTPLTNANRLTGRERMRRQNRRPRATKPVPSCKTCGGEVPHPDRDYCDACLPAYQREQFEQRFSRSGLAKLEQLKADGADPTHGGKASSRRGATNVLRKAELREWEQRHGKLVDLTAFQREILPLIQNVPLSRLVKATGLSLRYVSQVRRGEKVPHPRHWERFRDAAGLTD
jgi:CRISPR-associated endonuclease Cas1